ncbi:MAG: helix-turn-helix transcriptional regulator [Ilumatobacteraceae bacterium]
MNRPAANRAVYVISVAAELAGMHPQTLRIYERKGLLEPSRTAGGSRRYSDADIARLQRIAELAEAGMNLSGIRRVMELEAEADQLRAENRELRAALHQAATELDRREPRRDIVPLRQSVAVFGKMPSIFDR